MTTALASTPLRWTDIAKFPRDTELRDLRIHIVDKIGDCVFEGNLKRVDYFGEGDGPYIKLSADSTVISRLNVDGYIRCGGMNNGWGSMISETDNTTATFDLPQVFARGYACYLEDISCL